jgi:hypothetical protein
MKEIENSPKKSNSTNHCYCSVRGFYLRKTEKAMLLLRDSKPHWLPFSILFVNDPLVEKTIVIVDIPRWFADEHKFDSGFTPVTKEGREHNERLGFADFGIPQPSLDEYLLQQHSVSIRRIQRNKDIMMHQKLMKQVQISERQRELLRSLS